MDIQKTPKHHVSRIVLTVVQAQKPLMPRLNAVVARETKLFQPSSTSD